MQKRGRRIVIWMQKYSLLVGDCACAGMALALSFLLRFEGQIPFVYWEQFRIYFSMLGIALFPMLLVFRCYDEPVRSFDIPSTMRLGQALISGFIIFAALNWGVAGYPMPGGIIINCLLLTPLFCGGVRLCLRAGVWLYGRHLAPSNGEGKNVLIVGCGDAGRFLAGEAAYHHGHEMKIAAYIDDNERLWGSTIKGIRVIGGRQTIPSAVKEYGIQEIIIADPSLDKNSFRELISLCFSTKCQVRQFAAMSPYTPSDFSKARITDLRVEDLLGRDAVELDSQSVAAMVRGKMVLVTGGAGSIGSEICRQVLGFGARHLVIFDIHENGLFEIDCELAKLYTRKRYSTCLGSIRDVARLDEVFKEYRPDIVFHAAAHKHVPMMEYNPLEAIVNNVFGTYNTATAAVKAGVRKFILISTDKAVNPTNIMGASKRLAELVIKMVDHSGDMELAAVRFGNVLGSNGSVVSIFRRQILEGGPVTVTHRDIKRYFMTIPEAVQLVLQAGAMARGNEIFVLDMGDPVPIYDLAESMIRLSGLEPGRDIPIEITGLRPGEKLFEEISFDEENMTRTQNDHVFILRSAEDFDDFHFSRDLQALREAVVARDLHEVYRQVGMYVPTFANKVPEEAESILATG